MINRRPGYHCIGAPKKETETREGLRGFPVEIRSCWFRRREW